VKRQGVVSKQRRAGNEQTDGTNRILTFFLLTHPGPGPIAPSAVASVPVAIIRTTTPVRIGIPSVGIIAAVAKTKREA
jgi:hypothetical protein